jgi:putative transferase (TIGR04331 family)
LITLLENIILQIKLFQKIKIKDFHIISESIKESFFTNYYDFIKYTYSNDFRKLLNSLILKELDPKSINLKYINNEKIKVQNGKKIYKFILISILRLYIYFFKPILIINGYIGLKNTINFFFRSYGKIINIPGNFLFNEVNNNSFIDRNFRQRIRVHEIDIIDKIFNKIVGKFFPASYLENFNSINNDIKIISKKIKTIGTGSCHYSAIDHFNILTAEILKNKSGKLIIFQHGGTISKTNSLFREHIDQKYSSRCYYFDDPKGLGMHRFNEKKISFEEIKKRNSILILNSTTYFSKDFHYYPLKNINYNPFPLFFSKLNESNKKKTLVKLFPEKKSLRVENLWKKKFGNKINFLPTFFDAKKKEYFKAKLVILNEISTPVWDLLYLRLPFIFISSNKFFTSMRFKDSFNKKFIKLKKINIWFEDAAKAAQFVNSLDKDYLFEEWWEKTINSKIYLDFKNFLIVEKKNYLPRIVKELKGLK